MGRASGESSRSVVWIGGGGGGAAEEDVEVEVEARGCGGSEGRDSESESSSSEPISKMSGLGAEAWGRLVGRRMSESETLGDASALVMGERVAASLRRAPSRAISS